MTITRADLQKAIDHLSGLRDRLPPDKAPLLQPAQLSYLGRFLLPGNPDRQSQYDNFPYSKAIACLGPNGLYFSGHAHRTYVAEVSIPEPSKDKPVRAEFIQPFAELWREGIDQPRTGGLLYHDDRLYVSFERHYNVAHRQFPSLCWGPADLAKHVSAGTPLMTVTDPDGNPVDSELAAAPLAITPFGFTLVNQAGKHEAKSDGPALATADEGVRNFRQRMFFPRGSGLFPDPPNKWNETCSVGGVAAIGDTLIFCGQVGLATGLPELTGQNYFYGGPSAYPVPGVNVCKGPAAKGYHAPPYKSRLWFFSVDEIAKAKELHDPRPYAIVDLSTDEFLGLTECGGHIASIIWDEKKSRLYLTTGGAAPQVHVLAVKK